MMQWLQLMSITWSDAIDDMVEQLSLYGFRSVLSLGSVCQLVAVGNPRIEEATDMKQKTKTYHIASSCIHTTQQSVHLMFWTNCM